MLSILGTGLSAGDRVLTNKASPVFMELLLYLNSKSFGVLFLALLILKKQMTNSTLGT